jgi:hypothetical protein
MMEKLIPPLLNRGEEIVSECRATDCREPCAQRPAAHHLASLRSTSHIAATTLATA